MKFTYRLTYKFFANIPIIEYSNIHIHTYFDFDTEGNKIYFKYGNVYNYYQFHDLIMDYDWCNVLRIECYHQFELQVRRMMFLIFGIRFHNFASAQCFSDFQTILKISKQIFLNRYWYKTIINKIYCCILNWYKIPFSHAFAENWWPGLVSLSLRSEQEDGCLT